MAKKKYTFIDLFAGNGELSECFSFFYYHNLENVE